VGTLSGVISGAVLGTLSPKSAIGGMRSLCSQLGPTGKLAFLLFFSILEQLARGYEAWSKESLGDNLLNLLTAVLSAVILHY